jgi:hypothetical protein
MEPARSLAPAAAPSPAPAAAPAPRSPYLVGPIYDWLWFLLPPVISLCLGVLVAGTPFTDTELTIGDGKTLAGLFIGTMIQAHLVAVFVRSHANREIFRLHRFRFTVVPIALWIALASSMWLAVLATVVATFWDVWHSGAQTFGFARIYDRNAGWPPELGRRLDFWLSQLLYAGPILAGATLMDHVDSFDNFASVGDAFMTSVPARVDGIRGTLSWVVIGAGTAFVLYYLFSYWRFHRAGHRVPLLKVFLLASTGLCSVYTWGLNSWGEAFFIMNLFHAVQYLALVWAMERKRLTELARGRTRLAAAVMFGGVFAYGVGVELMDAGWRVVWTATIVVSLMHFWYDAFIWSVRKKQV